METLPLQLGDIVAVSVSGLKLMVLATSLKHAEGRAIPRGQTLASATMLVPSAGPNDLGALLVCGPSQVAQSGAQVQTSGFSGPDICVDVSAVEEHFPQTK